ncbi:MAG: ATP-binding protein [Caldilineales bacterium]|nr:ATP-binding protein [Caldilineales bacterium]
MNKSPVPPNPYIVGGWVTGKDFYGHTLLRHDILYGPNNYVWVIGTRRVGKTSLLRQLALDAGPPYLPIYWDLQGCESAADLGDELFYAVEEHQAAFAALGLDIAPLENSSLRRQLRTLCQAAAAHDRTLLLLIDEPEVLIAIAEREPVQVQRLRAAFQRPTNLRVVLASTKSLTRLEEISEAWPTSPFLAGFIPRHLSGLGPEEAEGLIRQVRAPQRTQVDEETVAAIQAITNNHAFLVQWLCYRLYQPDGSLRRPGPSDIYLDPMMASLFQQTYKHLSPSERLILLRLSQGGPCSVEGLAEALQIDVTATRIYLYALNRLGYTRKNAATGCIIIGNDFFQLWLEGNHAKMALDDAEVTDSSVQDLARAGKEQERGYWQQQLHVYRLNLARLEVQAANYGIDTPLKLQNELEFHHRKIAELEARLDTLPV